MGASDRVHTGDRCCVVKCLGRESREIVPGDKVTLHLGIFFTSTDRARLRTQAEAELGIRPEGQLAGLPSPIGEFDIATTNGYIHVLDGTFFRWDDSRAPGVPIFDYNGRPDGDPGWWPCLATYSDDCPTCRALRAEAH